MSAYIFVAVGGGSIGLLMGGVLTRPELALDLLRKCAYRHRDADRSGASSSWRMSATASGRASTWLGPFMARSPDGGDLRDRDRFSVGWGSPETLGFAGDRVVLFATFIVLESEAANPIMPLRILKLRSLTGSSVVRVSS